jgi:hypothetical protein
MTHAFIHPPLTSDVNCSLASEVNSPTLHLPKEADNNVLRPSNEHYEDDLPHPVQSSTPQKLQHGLASKLSHPESCKSRASQLREVLKTPTPASVNLSPQLCSSSSSLYAIRTVVPMSTASVQRWDRHIVVYVRFTPIDLQVLICGI